MEINHYKNEILQISRIIDMAQEGVTQPVICQMNTGIVAVVKYPHGRFGNKILINEYVGSCIADILHINMPSYGLTTLDDSVFENLDNEDILEFIDSHNSGLCFFSEYIHNTTPCLSQHIKQVATAKDLTIIFLDYLLNNYDRHEGNLLFDNGNRVIYSIDYSHIISKGTNTVDIQMDSIISQQLYANNAWIYNELLSLDCITDTVIDDVKVCIKELLTDVELYNIKSLIPREWIFYYEQYLDNMFRILSIRLSKLDEIADLLKKERRKCHEKKD